MSSEKLNMNGHDPEDFYITAKGAKVRFIGVNPTLIDKLNSAGNMPDVPYREIEISELGEVQKEPLSANDLQTDEEIRQWAEYVEKRDAILQKRNDNFLKAIFFHGVEIDDSTLDEWKQEQEEVWGLEVPNNRVDLKVDYVNSEVIGNAEDLGNMIAGVLGKSGVPKDQLEEMRATFRGALRGETVSETGEESAEGEVAME